MAKRVACEKCGNTVADTSRKCPCCGNDPNTWRRRLSVVGVTLFVLFIADAYFTNGAVVKSILAFTH
ncbi:MAG: hypothetical protein ACREBO_04300 [Novosphingobium sp.]